MGTRLRFSASYRMPAMIWFSHDIERVSPTTFPREGRFASRAQHGRSSVFTLKLYYDDIEGLKGSLGEIIISLISFSSGTFKRVNIDDLVLLL